MSKKVGRNDKCPCGSGKKYKKCCFDSGRAFGTSQAQPQPPSFFDQYNSIDLLKSFAGLTLLAQNHGKNVRIEELSSTCLRNFNDDKPNVSHTALTTFLSENYQSHYLEDPVTNLFSDLVTFYRGDYIIFPGITEGGSYVLSKLLTAIYNWPDSGIPDWFKNNCKHASLLILNLSDRIATRLGYSRYQFEEVESQLISIPNSTRLRELKAAVTFFEEEMEQLLRAKQIAREALDIFILEIKDPDLTNEHIEKSTLLTKPIIHYNGEYIITSPATLSYALVDFIHSEASTSGCLPAVSNAYHNHIWKYTQLHLKQLGFSRIDIPLLTENINPTIREGIYRFDDDKLAFVQYKTSGEATHEQRKQQIINSTLALPEFEGHQFMDISLISSMGQNIFFMYGNTENSVSIGMPIYDFDILVKLNEHDAIYLWNFANAQNTQISTSNIFGTSFFDLLTVYKENDDSFYISDECKNVFLHVEPGYGGSLFREAKILTDEHSIIRLVEGQLINLPVTRMDNYSPIYCCIVKLVEGDINMAIEDFPMPIWVSPIKNSFDVAAEARHLYYEFTEAIAYWLLQCQEFIIEELKHLNSTPVAFRFEFLQENRFYPIERDLERDEEFAGHFTVKLKGNSISIKIPPSIIPYLYSADNEGERELTRQLLHGINLLLKAHQKPFIADERIDQIIDLAAPLGVKKKIFILNSAENILLDPTNLEIPRYLQSYNANTILDSLVPGLGDLCPSIGPIKDKKLKTKLIRDVVIRFLLPKLQETICQYPNDLLLSKLICLNESLIHRKAELGVKTPTRIACFVTAEVHAVDMKKELTKLNQTSIAVRCLIEHLAAEPSTGNKIMSTTAIDELIALINAIVDWGSLGDQIEFDLVETEMSILPSGRIGTSKRHITETFDPYFTSKSKENISDAIHTFQKLFPEQNHVSAPKLPANLDNAFNEEFGISLTRISDLINAMGNIAYEQSSACTIISKTDLFKEINKNEDFSKEEFDICINYLSLANRGNVLNVPTGFENIDISPWRFNRRLSLLRKPLVLVDNPKDPDSPDVYYGFRQLVASRRYLFDQCATNRLRGIEGGPVQKVLGKLAQQKGQELVKSVLTELTIEGLIIDSEVSINTKSDLKHDKDIGDVDILVINPATKILYSLECKCMAPSRNMKEMIEEVGKLFGNGSNNGWIDKHIERDIWLKENLDHLGIKYGLDLSTYTVKSSFVTQEDMLTPYLKTRKSDLPFTTLYALREYGLDALN